MVIVEHQHITSTVLEHWWQYVRREHRLFLRLISEKPENLASLPYLEIIITKMDGVRVRTLRNSFPRAAQDIRSYLLSAERHFLDCLRAIRSRNLLEAEMYYHMAHNELSLLQYIFMEHGIKSYI